MEDLNSLRPIASFVANYLLRFGCRFAVLDDRNRIVQRRTEFTRFGDRTDASISSTREIMLQPIIPL
jgi:hypothetical protein